MICLTLFRITTSSACVSTRTRNGLSRSRARTWYSLASPLDSKSTWSTQDSLVGFCLSSFLGVEIEALRPLILKFFRSNRWLASVRKRELLFSSFFLSGFNGRRWANWWCVTWRSYCVMRDASHMVIRRPERRVYTSHCSLRVYQLSVFKCITEKIVVKVTR